MEKNKQRTKKSKQQKAVKYTKEQILEAKDFKHTRDALNILLDDKKSYTLTEVSQILDEFMKRKVQ